MQVLLRQGDKYLQRTGSWGPKETARDFTSGFIAYCWAKERKLLGAEVLLAFHDPRLDIVVFRVEGLPEKAG